MKRLRIALRGKPNLRHPIAYGGVILALVFGWVLVIFNLIEISSISSPNAAADAGQVLTGTTTDQGIRYAIVLIVVSLLILGLVYFGNLGRHFGASWPVRPADRVAPVARFIRFTCFALLAMMVPAEVVGVVFPHTADSVTATVSSLPWYGSLLIAAQAGVFEEVASIAAPIGATLVVFVLLGVTVRQLGRSGQPLFRMARPAAFIVGLLAALSRVGGHTYQGGIQAWEKLPWALGMLAVFWICKSIWPLIIAHGIFDFLFAGVGVSVTALLPQSLPPALMAAADPALVLLIAVCTFPLQRWEERRRRDRSPARPNSTGGAAAFVPE